MIFRKTLKILDAVIGIESNREDLLPKIPCPVCVNSLLTDFRMIEEVPLESKKNGQIIVHESPGKLSYSGSDTEFMFSGPFHSLIRSASDSRFSLWGNQGFLYRYVLYLLEKYHQIYSFHAAALYEEDEKRMFIIAGGAGSGKTVFILNGLLKKLKLFSTETVHFRMSSRNVTWYMGSLVDNVRVGTLNHDFPSFYSGCGDADIHDEWEKKVAIDLSSYAVKRSEIINPSEVVVLFPRIEEGRKEFILSLFTNKQIISRRLFDNISQKISESIVLYDSMPVTGFDTKPLSEKRLYFIDQLVHKNFLTRTATVLSDPKNCWGTILDDR